MNSLQSTLKRASSLFKVNKLKHEQIHENRVKDRLKNRVKCLFDVDQNLDGFPFVVKDHKKKQRGIHTKESNTPITQMVNLVSRTREVIIKRNTRSTSSHHTKSNKDRKDAYTAFRNSRSRQRLSPKKRTRLSTAKNIRELILPGEDESLKNIKLDSYEYKLPELNKNKIKTRHNHRSTNHPRNRKLKFFCLS